MFLHNVAEEISSYPLFFLDAMQSLVKPTVAKAFLKSMQDLNDTLLSTMCNFVRCIKPNAEMKCGVYNNRCSRYDSKDMAAENTANVNVVLGLR